MKPLSESLKELASRVQRLEDSAEAARVKNKAALEARRNEIERVIDTEVKEFETAVGDARDTLRQWWVDARASIERQIDELRAEYEKWRSEHRKETAERTAEQAEQDAAAAVALANYSVNAAEYAVLDAALARADAEDLAAAK